MRIVFFNYFHNGDLHISRGFVRQIMNKIHQTNPDVQFAYSHKMSPDLLSDIPNLQFDPNGLSLVHNEHANLVKIGDTAYINTWYGQQNHKYMNRHGISIDTIYAALDDTCKDLWNFSLNDISDNPSIFFPIIDYTKIDTSSVQTWLNQHSSKKILIENGRALSDQATNFPMGSIIDKLAAKYHDKIFILTSHERINNINNNIFFSDNITQRNGQNDLNKISYLSTYCDTIIGRSSGVFAFTLTQDNLFKRKITYFNFSNLVPILPDKYSLSYLLRDRVQYNSKIISTNESNIDKIFDVIDGNL